MVREGRQRDAVLWIWIIMATVVLLVVSCTKRVYVPVTEVHIVKEIIVDTVVEVVTPMERVINVTTDTISELRTSHAASTAEVIDGVLQHELVQHPRKDSVSVQIKTVQITDSIPYTVEVEVEKSVVPAWSWWTLAISGISIGGLLMRLIGKIKRA